MKNETIVVVISVVLGLTVLIATLSARAGERKDESIVGEVRAPDGADDTRKQAAQPTEDDAGTTILSIEGTESAYDQDDDEDDDDAPAASDQALLDGLLAIGPPAGWQLPAPPATDTADWDRYEAGAASMRVPHGWTVQNRIGEPGSGDETIGVSPPENDLYIELRHIRDADSSYRQTAADHAQGDYRRSLERLQEGVIFGYAPRVIDGTVGAVEIMDQFGKPVDEDGNPTFRLVLWRGRWKQDDFVQRAEFNATMAQDRYEALAPLVNRILATVEIRQGAE
jgi:hypothetical protein